MSEVRSVQPPATGSAPGAGTWLTVLVRPAGVLGRRESRRLADVLDPLAASASMVVVDLEAARLSGRAAAEVLEDAAASLDARGGCLLCVHADPAARDRLSVPGGRVVVLDAWDAPSPHVHPPVENHTGVIPQL
jgi:hypothetical protein